MISFIHFVMEYNNFDLDTTAHRYSACIAFTVMLLEKLFFQGFFIMLDKIEKVWHVGR